jgi:general secretion pathway protein K
MRYFLHKPSRGVALITAILVVSIATIAATAMTTRNYVNLRRTENVLMHDQSYLYLAGAEDWARNILLKDAKDNTTDSFKDDWATKLSKIPLDGGDISGRIDDLQGLFNINNLANGNATSIDALRFQKMLENAGASTDLLNTVMDWIDADDVPRFPGGAEDVDYLNGDNPYRAANQLLHSPTELLLVKGMTYELYAKLAPNLSALPQSTEINVNTAPAGVLQCIIENLSDSDAKKLIEERDKEPFKSVAEFLNNPMAKGKKIVSSGLTVSSTYFLLSARVQLDRTHAILQSVMYRPDAKTLRVILRSQGGV